MEGTVHHSVASSANEKKQRLLDLRQNKDERIDGVNVDDGVGALVVTVTVMTKALGLGRDSDSHDSRKLS